MTRISWDNPKERIFEAGVEKGVFYPIGGIGVPWNGLIAVDETASGGEQRPQYQDGVRTHNHVTSKEFAADISAFTYPEEFEPCVGVHSIADGFSVDEQNPRPFHLSYQTKIGDGVLGLDLGYRIHLVYNALAVPALRKYKTASATPEIDPLIWSISTTPIAVPNRKPASHFTLDSRKIQSFKMDAITRSLYGTSYDDPRMPSIGDVLSILSS